jgi:hypothetical protein
MSRAMVEAPTTSPFLSLTGDMENEPMAFFALLQVRLGLEEFLILELKFDAMHLLLVEQPLRVFEGEGLEATGIRGCFFAGQCFRSAPQTGRSFTLPPLPQPRDNRFHRGC